MSLHQQMDDVCQQRRVQANQLKLMAVIKTKLRNSFIGDLASIEKWLGAWIGLGTPEAERSAEQATLCRIWEECRREILTNGNNQIRSMEKEIAGYVITPQPPA